jgi:hypothetical protein
MDVPEILRAPLIAKVPIVFGNVEKSYQPVIPKKDFITLFQSIITPLWILRMMKEYFVVKQRKSTAASLTKRIELTLSLIRINQAYFLMHYSKMVLRMVREDCYGKNKSFLCCFFIVFHILFLIIHNCCHSKYYFIAYCI